MREAAPITVHHGRLDGEYVLPLRWEHDGDLPELTTYLRELCGWLPVTVVDGSPPEGFDRHARAWAGLVRHIRPGPWPGANGKVAGVVTGVRAALHERLVIADDDVRYDRPTLQRVLELLDGADVVRPQNVFTPTPWHARWDTGRTLLNRAVWADYPGTFGLRRSTFLAMGGYDGDVLFENLEMLRTVRAAGGTVRRASDVFVLRRAPGAGHFWSQRVRQAYDDLAQPWRLVGDLAVWPFLVHALARRRPWRLVVAVLAVIGTAELGRRRNSGRTAFPPTAALWAPVWVLERGTCSWLALGTRVVHGGVSYGGGRLRTAAHSTWQLRRRRRPPLPDERSVATGRVEDLSGRGELGRHAPGGEASPVLPERGGTPAPGGYPHGMDTESTPANGANARTVPEESAPPLPDDPRVPQPDDADPTTSKELGGAAPAVGPRTRQ